MYPKLPSKHIPWISELISRSEEYISLLHGRTSPIEILDVCSFESNVDEFIDILHRYGFPKERICFARKANDSELFLKASFNKGIGLDISSEAELDDALRMEFPTQNLVVTSAVKSKSFLKKAVENNIIISIDNSAELKALNEIGHAKILLRISSWMSNGLQLSSRFGFIPHEFEDTLQFLKSSTLEVVGIHFHLKSYLIQDRVSGIECALMIIDQMREMGMNPKIIDIGGGIPVNYLKSQEDWHLFEAELKHAVLGNRDPITYQNNGLGWQNSNGTVSGARSYYPYWNTLTKSAYIKEILETSLKDKQSVYKHIKERGLELQIEPGRALLDNAGCLLSKVAAKKIRPSGISDLFLYMNRTQLMSSSADFCVDPVLLSSSPKTEEAYFLFGSYCVDDDIILKRIVLLPEVKEDDTILFPNTAPYITSLYASESHRLGKVDRYAFHRKAVS